MNIRRQARRVKFVAQQLSTILAEVNELTAACGGDQGRAIVLLQATTNYVRAGGTASSLSALTRMELAMREGPS